MAKQVEGISEKVELCAKKEFLEKGYVDASLRTIAAEAGTTTGTIYSRYGGKEGLFSAIVEPVAKEFTGIFIGVQEKFHAIESDRQAVSLDDYAEACEVYVRSSGRISDPGEKLLWYKISGFCGTSCRT